MDLRHLVVQPTEAEVAAVDRLLDTEGVTEPDVTAGRTAIGGRSAAARHACRSVEGCPARKPHATPTLVTRSSRASSSLGNQAPWARPTSAFRSIAATCRA